MERVQLGGRPVAGFGIGGGCPVAGFGIGDGAFTSAAEVEAVRTKLRSQSQTIGPAVNNCKALPHADRTSWWRLSGDIDEYLAQDIASVSVFPGVIWSNDRNVQIAQGQDYLKRINPWYDKLRTKGCLNEATPEPPPNPPRPSHPSTWTRSSRQPKPSGSCSRSRPASSTSARSLCGCFPSPRSRWVRSRTRKRPLPPRR